MNYIVHGLLLTFKTITMKTQKILVGTLVAGVAMFLLGWLIYGVMLSGFMQANCDHSTQRPMGEMMWWALILSNFVSGLLLALVLYWSGSLTMGTGAKTGAVLGFLIALSFDLMMYSMTTMYSTCMVVIVDAICYGLMFAVAGAITAKVMSKVGNAKA
jgi:hypothetical protein